MTSIREFVAERQAKIAASTFAAILVALGQNTHPVPLNDPTTQDPWAELEKLIAAGGRPIGVAGFLRTPTSLDVFIERLPELRDEEWPKPHIGHFVEYLLRQLGQTWDSFLKPGLN